jgi:hypothetical protein
MAESLFIRIQSAKFPILLGEDAELVNEGMYGKAFAQYLQARLIERGYQVSFVCCEDWGWWVELKGQPFALGLCIYGRAMEDGSLDLCVCASAEPERRWSWTRFRVIDRTPRVNQLNTDLKAIVESDPDIRLLSYTADFPLE